MQLNIIEELPSSFQASVLVAGWPGMGGVGIGAIDYMRRKLNAVAFAEIDMAAYFTPEAVMVEDGLVTFPPAPAHTFYAVEEHDLVIFQSEAQIAGAPGDDLMHQILDLGQRSGVHTIFTSAAYGVQVSYKEGSQVLGVANNSEFRDSLVPFGIEILQEGMVSGLNGLLLGFAAERNLNAACLLGTMPQYAAPLPNPAASKEIVLALGRILNFDVDMSEIDEAAQNIESTMEEIEAQIQGNFPHIEDAQNGDPVASGEIDDESVPQDVMEHIEKLFLEATRYNIRQLQFQEKTNELKRMLDTWNLYPFYEDRFLNLFR